MILRFAVMGLLAIMLAVSGCATHKFTVSKPESDPEKRYDLFRSNYGYCNATGIKTKASLYYTSEGQGHRTTMTLWGNFDSPLRLDVRAGIGAYVAHIREDRDRLIAFYPDQKTAYSHSSPLRAVQLLGLPFPFSLKDLAGLIAGCYQSLIPQAYNTVNSTDISGNYKYSFRGGTVGSITLTDQGTASEITGRGEMPWRMELSSYEPDDSGKLLPGKITVYTEKGDKAVLRIKSRTFTAWEWQSDSLKMELPEGTEEIRLDKNGYSKIY